MSKRIFAYFAAAMLCASAFPALAQNISTANNDYRAFVSVANSGSDKDRMYDALYQCYKSNMAVINASSRNSSDYRQALTNLRDIMAYIPNAAAYNNSMRRQSNAILFAEAYVDAASLPDFEGDGFSMSPNFAKLAYFAASNLVNSRRTREAIPYLQAYLRSGDTKYRKSVYVNLAKACQDAGDIAGATAALKGAVEDFPTDFSVLSAAVNLCIDTNDTANLERFVTKALSLRPGDPTLLNIKGKLCEDKREYEEALEIYQRLQRQNPRALDVAKHIAVCNYNLGVLSYNNAMGQTDKNARKRLEKDYREHFALAADMLESVVASDPASVKYTKALAVAYNCSGNTSRLTEVNNKLASLGGGRIAADFIPTLISYGADTDAPVPSRQLATTSHSPASTAPAASAVPAPAATQPAEVPAYSEYARSYIEREVNQWQQKDPYETLAEYNARVTEATRRDKIAEVQKQAEANYINEYGSAVSFSDLELRPYDAENEAFLITSALGELIVPVPRGNNEARLFESNWTGMQFKDPKFFIHDDKLGIAALTFVTPTGKEYRYDNDAALNYTETIVDVAFAAIDHSAFAHSESGRESRQNISRQQVKAGSSDVDRDIPETKVKNDRTFAVIISNENYLNAAAVPLALNDGATFAQYCHKTLGLPEDNVRYYPDASFGTMLRAVRDIKEIASAYNSDLDIIFYYAGHGIPNESTKDAFLLPVDADCSQTEGCYSLNRLYGELGGTGARSVLVFLDACFSGSKRDEGMLASARGVAIKPKKEDPRGNMVVFSAASDDETAFPFKREGHGLFTYYLLKKLKETRGDVSLGELGKFISENVRRQAVVINKKPQTTTVSPSASMADKWSNLKIIK